MKCPRCQQDNPSHAKFCLACGAPLGVDAALGGSYADLQAEIEKLGRSLGEAAEQQTATAEILRAISASSTGLQGVLDTVAARASWLCGAANVSLYQVEGDVMRKVAERGPQLTALPVGGTRPITRGSVSGRAILDRSTIHLRDQQAPEVSLEFPDGARQDTGIRTTVGIPLLREGLAIGAFTVYRSEYRPFSDGEIALLRTFADQAVIAIENVRLFNETKEALEQQTATADILRVIARSPTDVQPVFNAIVESATRLCAASVGHLFQFDGELLSLVAQHNSTPEMDEALQRIYPMRPSRGQVSGRAILNRTVVHIPDVFSDPEYRPDVAATVGLRSRIGIPLLREGNPIGVIVINRTDPGLFADNHIDLLQTFADQAVIAIENARLFNETREALERQTATSDILRVISISPTDAQPVFETIAANAARLCAARDAQVLRVDGDVLRLVAAYGSPSMPAVRPISRGHAVGRAVIDRETIHVRDMAQAIREFPDTSAPQHGVHSVVAVPLLRNDVAVGVIRVSRTQIQPFTETQTALLQIFADQALIAIENVRLFTELQEKNRALTQAHAQVTEALEQQTATSEILKVIARSPTDTQPVFDAIAENAARLCSVEDVFIVLVAGDALRAVAGTGQLTGLIADYNARRVPVSRTSVAGRVIVDRTTMHIDDLAAVPEDKLPDGRALQRMFNHRTILATPLLREGAALGAIVVFRLEVRPFSERQQDLLQTFADQAVIAIENVRLFTELQASNRELRIALDRQTATSDILRVISGSQTDVQPVFDAIMVSAVRLLRGHSGGLTRVVGDQLVLAALTSTDPAADDAQGARYPQPVESSEDPHALSVRTRASLNVANMQDEARFSEAMRAAARARGFHSLVAVPLLRGDEPLGALTITRRELGGFTEDEITLLQTFADQAVIAIENARLLGELRARTDELTRSVQELTALSDVSRALSSTLDLDAVLQTIVTRANRLAGTDACSVFEYDEATEAFHLRATNNLDEEVVRLARQTPVRKGEGVQGRMAVTRQPVQVPDIAEEDAYRGPLRDILLRAGTRAVLAIPMLREDQLIGGLTVNKRTPGEFSPEVIELLTTFATQSALAIQNARLFHEIEDKSRQLEAASQHKSEFLANMSHELRTPLNAIIGFSEVLSERMFGELNEKQDEYLKDIHASGQHLLSLINDILDLSKVEAGRMELELTDVNLLATLDNALTLVRERAGRHGIALHMSVDERVGQVRADERKIRQVVLNLLSNAIKFTPEGGEIEVRAKAVDGSVEVSVTDTGVGIAPEDQEAIFEEFKQVGTAAKKVEGTGLGLALSRKFIELHGGRIWVQSQVGVGSTFTFTIPVRHGE